MGLVPVDTVMALPQIVGAHSEAEVQSAIDYASDAIESYCERCFTGVVADVVTVSPFYSHVKAMPAIAPMASYGSYPGYGVSFSAFGSPYVGSALLPDPPVAQVSLVQAMMPLVSDDSPGWQTLVNYQFNRDGYMWDTSGMPGQEMSDGGPEPSWPVMPYSLQVTYTHGYALPGGDNPNGLPALPSGIVSAVVRSVANILANPANVASYKYGDVSTTFTQMGRNSTSVADALSRIGLDDALLGKYRLVHL